jgi:hypothetical protein
MVDTTDVVYPISRGLLIEYYMHLSHVAPRSERSLLPKVERSVVVAKNWEHPFEGPREVPCILPITVSLLWPFKQPSHTFRNLQLLEHNLLVGVGLMTSHLQIFKIREAFYKSREVNSRAKGCKIDFGKRFCQNTLRRRIFLTKLAFLRSTQIWYHSVTPGFKAKTKCSSYVCLGTICHTYG